MSSGAASQIGEAKIGIPPLVGALARAGVRLVVFVAIVAMAAYAVLSQVAPLYLAQATVLVDRSGGSAADDREAVARAIQLLNSADLARTVAQDLDLHMYAEFDPALGPPSLIADFLTIVGLRRDPLRLAVEERVLQRLAAGLHVRRVEGSRVVAIEYVSANPVLAADIANRIAQEYVHLQVTAGEVETGARVLSWASVPTERSFPRTAALVALAAGGALFLGMLFVLLRELARYRRARRAAFRRPLPVVPGAVPVGAHKRWADEHGTRHMMAADPSLGPDAGDSVEDSLAAIAAAIIKSGVRRIMVTTAEGSEESGRPLAAAALARVLARAEQRTVLVDLRDDTANSASMGEGDDRVGFSELFTGEASFAEVIFRDRQSRAHFIPRGRRSLPSRQLGDSRARMLFSAIDQTYDQLIFDLADEAIAIAGEECEAAVVVSEFPAADPRTVRAFDRISAASDARIMLLIVDPALPAEMPAAAEPVRSAA